MMGVKSTHRSPRRSFLFTPGDSIRKIRKVTDVRPDCVILDLEDAVVFSQKEKARQNVITTLASLDFGRTERLVRVNWPDTEMFTADLEAIEATKLDGIVLPKVTTAEQIEHVDQAITTKELNNAWIADSIRLFVIIETALGIMNLKEICQASQRIEGLIFGAEDLAADLGTARSQAGWEVFYGRGAVVTAAAAYSLEAIDTVYLNLHDATGMEQDASFGRQLGYTGKLAIHPGQIEVINRVYSPTEEEIVDAESLLEAYQSQVAAGSGVFTRDGRMVDLPHILFAERLLERAALCRLMDE